MMPIGGVRVVIKEDIYIEHYGTPGMKWGVRNKGSAKPLTSAQKVAKKKKIKKTITNVAAIAIGAAFIASMFIPTSSVGRTPVSSLSASTSSAHRIGPSAAAILRAQERQRNGAFQTRQLLLRMGEDVV
jgi:hypothetical protein